jgi:hypothetical protein
MAGNIPIALVQDAIADCESRLGEIVKALSTELAKPMHQRDPLLLTFLGLQRQKVGFSIEALSRLFNAGDDVRHGSD